MALALKGVRAPAGCQGSVAASNALRCTVRLSTVLRLADPSGLKAIRVAAVGQTLSGGKTAAADGTFPNAFKNEVPDPSFDVSPPSFLDQLQDRHLSEVAGHRFQPRRQQLRLQVRAWAQRVERLHGDHLHGLQGAEERAGRVQLQHRGCLRLDQSGHLDLPARRGAGQPRERRCRHHRRRCLQRQQRPRARSEHVADPPATPPAALAGADAPRRRSALGSCGRHWPPAAASAGPVGRATAPAPPGAASASEPPAGR